MLNAGIIEAVLGMSVPVVLLIARAAIDHSKIKELESAVKILHGASDSCKLELQKKIDSEKSFEKFVHISVYSEGMKNLEEKMLKEMEHLNKTMNSIFKFMQKESYNDNVI